MIDEELAAIDATLAEVERLRRAYRGEPLLRFVGAPDDAATVEAPPRLAEVISLQGRRQRASAGVT